MLEGVGKKTAMRMAFSVLEMDGEEVESFAQALLDAKNKIHLCPVCQNLTDRELCPICADETRDSSIICVVTDARTVLSMEKVREFRGVYHVLHGLISPMNGITPDKLKIKELLYRVEQNDVEEIIVATNPTVEGEATAMYLSKLLRPFGVKITRLAYGVPVGADLEYADEITLFRALEGRREV
jgi:recombination protein RecR